MIGQMTTDGKEKEKLEAALDELSKTKRLLKDEHKSLVFSGNVQFQKVAVS